MITELVLLMLLDSGYDIRPECQHLWRFPEQTIRAELSQASARFQECWDLREIVHQFPQDVRQDILDRFEESSLRLRFWNAVAGLHHTALDDTPNLIRDLMRIRSVIGRDNYYRGVMPQAVRVR